MHRPACMALAALVLVAAVAGLRSPHYNLRESPPSSCGFAHFGSTTGSAQRLVETHLSPGVADWNIVVPMPQPCAQAPVTGVRMRVCDTDSPPDVSLSDAQSARVHRTGALTSFAAVNVTVYCILPPQPPPAHLTDSRSTYEMLSEELSSNETTSNEEISNESESIELTSVELITTVKPTSSTTLAPAPVDTTTQVLLTSPAEVITPPPYKMVHPKEKPPQSLKVTINITPTNQVSTKEDVSQYYDVELPSLSNKEKPDEMMSSQSPTLSQVPFIATPPRISELLPRKRNKRPRGSGRPLSANPPRVPLPTRGPPRLPRRQRHHPGAPKPPQYMQAPQFSAVQPYKLSPPPYPVAPVYRPLSLLGPRLPFLQRYQPLLIYRHF